MASERRQTPRLEVNWPVRIKGKNGDLEAAVTNVSPKGAFIRCSKPLRLNEIFEMIITAPGRSIKARAEVIWSNTYGPDDHITPRGMGVLFLRINSEDGLFIIKAIEDFTLLEVADTYLKELEIGGKY